MHHTRLLRSVHTLTLYKNYIRMCIFYEASNIKTREINPWFVSLGIQVLWNLTRFLLQGILQNSLRLSQLQNSLRPSQHFFNTAIGIKPVLTNEVVVTQRHILKSLTNRMKYDYRKIRWHFNLHHYLLMLPYYNSS